MFHVEHSAPGACVFLQISPRIRIFRAVREVLPREPALFFVGLGDIDAFELEDDEARAVVAAGDHHALVVRPAVHDAAANISSTCTITCNLPAVPDD